MRTFSVPSACRTETDSQASYDQGAFQARRVAFVAVQRTKRRVIARSTGDLGPSDGNAQVQEQLIQQLQQGISQKRQYDDGKEKLKAEVRRVVEAEGERLRRATEEAKLEVDKLEELMKKRSALEFGSALADINKEADDFEEKLRQSRAEMENNQAEFAAWERKVAKDRSQGQFFQKLYQVDKQPGKGAVKPSPAREVQVLHEAESIGMTTRAEVHSPLRANIFFFLSISLTLATGTDLLSGEPSLGLDALYASLALLLGGSAYWERQSTSPSRRIDKH